MDWNETTEWQPGQTVAGFYTIVREIGRGGMGVVHLAREGQGGRLVAIKSPLREWSQHDGSVVRFFDDATARQRFTQEATAWMELGCHPNIVRAFDVQEFDYLPRIFMEYCDGGALSGLVLKNPKGLPFQEAYDLAAQICWGLAFGHENGLVKRVLRCLSCPPDKQEIATRIIIQREELMARERVE